MSSAGRILIVDDHPTNIAVLEELLGDTYELAIATSGEEALAMAPDFHPALILLDVMMPGISGYETCRRLRALPLPACRMPKIILVSAKAMVSERLQGYEAGADDYVTKPFDAQELLAKVRVYLRLKSIEEVEQLKSDVLALLNHEMRTPLNGLIVPLQMLKTETDLPPEERLLLLDMASQSATRLQRLCEKVVTLGALHTGHWDVQCVTADLREVARSAVEAVTAEAVERRVQLASELPAAAITRCDPRQMQGVITTLLENAIRFSPPDGQVCVQVAQDTAHCYVRVTDQGTGIAPDCLPQVFEAFAPNDIMHHSAGHGLSLAIAQHITFAHHGTIQVESTQGVGTSFTVRLPHAAESLHAAAHHVEEQPVKM
jgi:signal transduction histidine kinase